jgi:hypothetical protein
MPNAVTVIFGGDSRPLKQELAAIEALSARAGARIQTGMAGGGHSGSSGIMRETLVLAREISRGNWSRVPGSLTILAQRMGVLKLLTKSTAQESEILAQAMEKEAAAASLSALRQAVHAERLKEAVASGKYGSDAFKANAAAAEKEMMVLGKSAAEKTRAAESARALANAEASVGEGAVATLSPLAYVAAGLTAAGVAAYFVYRYFRTLREESNNLRDILKRDVVLFSVEADAMKRAASESQGFSDWLRALGDDHETLSDKINDTLKLMREEARMQREIAEGKGASKRDLENMTAEELQKELNLVTLGKLEAARNLEHDKGVATTAEHAANDPRRAAKIADLGTRSKEMAAIADAIQQKMKTAFVAWKPGDDPHAAIAHKANRNDTLEVEVGGKKYRMSLAEAEKHFKEVSGEEQRLVKVQKELNDLLSSKKKKTEKDQKDIDRLTKEQTEIQNDLQLRAKYAGQVIDAGHENEKAAPERISLNAQQRLGAYAATPPDMKNTNDLLKGILRNTEHLKPPAPQVNKQPLRFGGHA